MSALTDDISRRHWRLGVGHPDIDVCLCGWKQHRDNGQIGYSAMPVPTEGESHE